MKNMTLLKYSPFGDVDDMPGIRQMQDTFSRLFAEPNSRPWTPAVDILETENELVAKMDIPEVELKDVDIRLENHTLTVKGERKFENEKVRADYKNGVLSIVLPKKEVAKPRTIKVEISNN
jgi:HSP20 family protein